MEKRDIAVPQGREEEASAAVTPALVPQPSEAADVRATTSGAAAPGVRYTRTPDCVTARVELVVARRVAHCKSSAA